MESKTSFSNNDSVNIRSLIYETEILRKAYELILENSDLFFRELTKAFTLAEESGQFEIQI